MQLEPTKATLDCEFVKLFSLGRQINDAFERVKAARKAWQVEWQGLQIAQAAYDDCKRDMILGGHVIGKNAEEREAKLADLLRVQITQLREAQLRERFARFELEIASDEVSRLKLLVAADAAE